MKIEDIEARVREIDEKVYHLCNEKYELQKEIKGYFVGIEDDGSDTNYYLLDETTAAVANQWACENNCSYKRVSEDDYLRFISIYKIDNAISALETVTMYDIGLETERASGAMDTISSEVKELIEHILELRDKKAEELRIDSFSSVLLPSREWRGLQ